MSEFVIDASLAAAFAVPGEPQNAKARALILDLAKQNARLIAPPLFEAEADSIIRRLEFTGKLTEAASVAAQAVMDALPVETIYDANTRQRAREIAKELNLVRVYDSTYAALADLRDLEFWTADERFYNAAKSALPFVRFIGNY